MAFVKLSELPIIENPASDATVIGVSNGTTGRFTQSSGTASTKLWTSVEPIEVNAIVTYGTDHVTIIADLRSATFEKNVAYMPIMKYSASDITTYGLSTFNNKIIEISTKKYTTIRQTKYLEIYIYLPNVEVEYYILFTCGQLDSDTDNNISCVAVMDPNPSNPEEIVTFPYIIKGGELATISASMASSYQIEYLTIKPFVNEYRTATQRVVENSSPSINPSNYHLSTNITENTILYSYTKNPV